ncbi:uncharacterized protein B0H64DRAFT_39565 [Chaetomium fimeti]|uniref:Uncharacterized protein n=1 Tax=Chaetomium fimeti TaxID=1854472 RepID=A0AAE0HRP5_9PEZI|nr:hypothetical protein B0H64DRAFT_39565 [Chaetomium fimeti]
MPGRAWRVVKLRRTVACLCFIEPLVLEFWFASCRDCHLLLTVEVGEREKGKKGKGVNKKQAQQPLTPSSASTAPRLPHSSVRPAHSTSASFSVFFFDPRNVTKLYDKPLAKSRIRFMPVDARQAGSPG